MDVLLFVFYSPIIVVMLRHSFDGKKSPKLDFKNVVALLWQVFLVIYAFMVIAFVRYVVRFGYKGLRPPQGAAAIAFGTFIVAIAWYLATRPLKYNSRGGENFPHERWLFINGIGSGQTWQELNCETLATMFGRKILGINNRTFGLILDVFECIIQRCFGYTTEDARQLYYSVQSELRKDDIHKVVLIAHSQGAIIASLVVDRLLASESTTNFKKLELYTFASAANHIHGAGAISCIEHFVNKWDFIAQASILSYQPGNLAGNNRYDGKIYIDNDEIGHSLSTHYLPSMFAEGGPGARSHMAKYLGGKTPSMEATVAGSVYGDGCSA
ncbi:hypothetical protein BGZ93_005159 [Podila epicladia]|nr:hypothetical protein BGZ93_005159 [Podila epicladia]